MSQFGMTPISILDKSPMGGFRGGMADQRSVMHSNSALETEGLTRQQMADELEKSQLNRPVDAAKRALDLAKAENEQADITSGAFNKARETERQIRMQELLDKTNEVQRKQLLQKAEDSVAVASVFSPEDNDQTRAEKWAIAKQIADQRGIQGFPGEYSIQNWQKLQAQSQAAPSMIKMIQEKDMTKFKSGVDLDRSLIEKAAGHKYASALQEDSQAHTSKENSLNRANNLAIARERINSNDGKPLTKSQVEAEAIQTVQNFMNKVPNAPKPTQLQIALAVKAAYGTQVEDMVDKKVQNDPEVKAMEKSKADLISVGTWSNEGAKREADIKIAKLEKQIEERKAKVAAQIEERIPGYSQFKKEIKDSTGITVPPGATVRRIEGLPGGPVSDAPSAPTTTKPTTVTTAKPINTSKLEVDRIYEDKNGVRMRWTGTKWEKP
jgi:hypothetical protein